MAKNSEQNKLLFFEPNSDDNALIPNEDINIFVELETTSKGRSIINIENNGEGKIYNKGGKTTSVKFIDGNGKTNSLTTDYTKVSSFTDKEEDIQTLGIENIDIDFDTAYTPLIKIKFIDVRGKSIFENGSDGKYSVFFDLPYPIFSLTVKGYYGRPVKYCLHLLKFNAKFNSKTGNFEIDAEFIGYTYAILTDLLLGYLRAVVYTKEGSKIFNGIKEEYAKKGIVIKTIDEFLKDIETIADEIVKIKNEDEKIKELNTSNTIRDGIKTIKNRILSLNSVIIPKGSDYFNDGRGVICVDPKKGEEEVVKNSIEDYKKKIKLDLDDPKTGLNSKINIDNLKFRTNNIINFITIKGLKYDDFSNVNSEIIGTEKIFATNLYERDDENENSNINKFVSDLAITLGRKLPKDRKGNPSLLVYDFRKCLNEIDRVEDALIKNEKRLREEIAQRISNLAKKKLNFEPTVRNIFRVLTTHCEVLLETIAKVSADAEKSSSRDSVLKSLSGQFNIKENDEKIYPWPEFRVKENSGDGKKSTYEESWIGGESGVSSYSEQQKVDEIVFVEDLLKQLLNIAQSDIDAEIDNGELLGPQFFPVSTLDTRFTKNLTKNPYKVALTTPGTSSRAVPEEATRCLLLRGFLGLGVSNRQIPDLLIEGMGQLEAYNLFNVIIDNFTRSNARPILTEINSGGNISDKVSNLINTWKSGIDGTGNNPFNKKTPLLVEDGDTYLYTYITDSPTASKDKTYNRAYIPISGKFDGADFYKNENENGNIVLKNAIELKKLSNEVSFVGNNFGSTLNSGDNLKYATDGSVYLKILNSEDYDKGLNSPKYGNGFLNDYRKLVPENSLINQNTLADGTYKDFIINTLDPYSGKYKALEIFDMVYNLNDSDFITSGECIIYNKDGKKQEKEGSILASFWSQRDYSSKYKGGTYLAKGNDVIRNKPMQSCVGCGINNFNLNKDRLIPKDYGKQRELLGELLGEVSVPKNNTDIIYTPFIEFGVANHEDNTLNYFSLFGSQFYYRQTSDEAKALLFLHSFGWQGLIGDIKDEFIFNTTDVSLFDVFDNDGESFESEDDTPTIKSIFKNNGAFIKAPKLWCAFIGGMLHRYHEGLKSGEDIINFNRDENGSFIQIFPWQDILSYVPKYDQYLYDTRSQSPFGINFVFDSGDLDRDDTITRQKYAKLDETLLNLPAQVKLEFINKFKLFVKDDFPNIKDKLEVWSDSSTETYEEVWDSLNDLKFIDYNTVGNYPIISISNNDIKRIYSGTSVTESYENISPASNELWNDVKIYQYNLKIKPKSDITTLLNNLICQKYIIQNGVPKAFNQPKEDSTSKYELIKVDKVKYEKYLTNFFYRFEKLVDEFEKGVINKSDDLEQKIFKTINDDLIKLNIYRSLGSLYNKWIAGSNSIFGQCGISTKDKEISEKERDSDKPKLIDSFRFLDRAFNDLGDKLYINPIAILRLVRGNYNQSFFDLSNRILTDNNFNFIALPSFLNFNDISQLKEMFTPYTYYDLLGDDYKIGPSFVCTYIGQTSTNLDLGDNSNYPDDGVLIRFDENGQIYDAPEDFINTNDDPRDLNIPMVSVSYGKQNQSFFKDINLDQREFTETSETLEIIEDISKSGDKRKPTSVGQNLFNVYQTRSYSAEIEMMGNAMMQPMMYFQLNNIPMFRGAYMILKVTHNIKANSMTTKFKGVRIKRGRTKLVDSTELFMELLGSLNDLGNAKAINGPSDTTSSNDTTPSNNETDVVIVNIEDSDITGIIIEG